MNAASASFFGFFRLAPLVLSLSLFRAFAAEGEGKPNLVLIMADDLGYECVAANGGAPYQTPVLDRLAAEGMRFEHCYSQPLCTPSRVQIMTGMYNVRNYRHFGTLERGQQTFAHVLKQAGYATAIAGKWQLGSETDSAQHFGFDASCLWQHTRGARDANRRDTRYPQPCLEINGKPVDYPASAYGPDVVTDFLCDFMEQNRDRPFLLYYPMILPHSPFVPTPDSDDPACTDVTKNFQDMVAYVDKMVGRICDKIEALGLQENTLVLFTGDNGTSGSINSTLRGKPFRGGKGRMTDAGTHVPLIAHWPGTIPAGTVSQELVDFSDFLPTLCDAAGGVIPADLPMDGRSFLPQLRGEKGQPRDWVYCWYLSKKGVVASWARTRQYKLYGDGAFYDLNQDPEEKSARRNLTLGELEQHRALQAVLEQFQNQRPAEWDTRND